MKYKILDKNFYKKDTKSVAKQMLGKYLVRRIGKKILAYPIIETEAYIGPHDKASHAYKGYTKRTSTMFGPPGHAYIYLVYGMHNCLNIVTRKEGYPAAVLIRALDNKNTKGPGRLTKVFKISKSLNGIDITKKDNIWIEDRGVKIKSNKIISSPRIGVYYAEEWSKKPFRYTIKNND